MLDLKCTGSVLKAELIGFFQFDIKHGTLSCYGLLLVVWLSIDFAMQ